MEEIAEVVEDRGDTALVRLRRRSACGECNRRCGLAGNREAGEVTFEVKNTVGAGAGQRVRLSIEERRGIQAALLVFLFPLLSMLIGYFLAVELVYTPESRLREGIGFGVSLLFLALSFLLIRYLDRRGTLRKRFSPRMIGLADGEGD